MDLNSLVQLEEEEEVRVVVLMTLRHWCMRDQDEGDGEDGSRGGVWREY